MRKLIVCEIVSLDGRFEGAGGNVMALPMDAFFDACNLERVLDADIMLLGADGYRGFSGFWPSAIDNEEFSRTTRATAVRNRDLAKVVVSDSLTDDDLLDGWGESEVVRRADAHERVAALKAEDGGDIVMFGSAVLARDLLAAGLVDEVHLVIAPVVLPDGVPFLDETAPALTPIAVRTDERSANVQVRYAVAR